MPPADTDIAARIDAVDPTRVDARRADDPLIESARRPTLIDAYLDAVPGGAPACPTSPACRSPTPRCTASAARRCCAAFDAAGLPRAVVVAEQQEPDGTFPTVSFPNPEEPGAMDLLLALGRRGRRALALANDPDADRLGAAIPQPDGSLAAAHAATRSAGCSPTTSCATRPATIGS